jgi:hypothetical protein
MEKNTWTLVEDACDSAADFIAKGFLLTLNIAPDGPYHGCAEAALRGACFGDEHTTAPLPDVAGVDVEELQFYIATFRDEIYELGKGALTSPNSMDVTKKVRGMRL